MASTCYEILWLQSLMIDFGIHHTDFVKLFSDSQSVVHICKTPFLLERTKLIEIDYHFIKEKFNSGLIEPIHVPTNVQLTDLFIKALQPHLFLNLLSKMNVHDVHNSS